MTSPIVHGDVIVYGSAAGIARTRSLVNGALLHSTRMPGGVIMAPPASAGDTAFFSLDENALCALLMPTLKTLWCRRVPHSTFVGHAALTATDGLLIVSSIASLRSISVREFLILPMRNQARLLWTNLAPPSYWAGQRFEAYDMHDGHRVWSSRVFGEVVELEGHTAGTATVVRGNGVIVLPDADTLVGFNARTGEIRWTAPALRSRGPALIVNESVVVFGSQGTMQTRALATGALGCTDTKASPTDRAGPARAGDRLLVAALDGRIESISLSSLSSCMKP